MQNKAISIFQQVGFKVSKWYFGAWVLIAVGLYAICDTIVQFNNQLGNV